MYRSCQRVEVEMEGRGWSCSADRVDLIQYRHVRYPSLLSEIVLGFGGKAALEDIVL
jgi:hypothetical protein